MGQLIDSLNTTQFFIKDRPNPDVPLPGREADIRARQRRSGTTALPVEYPDETYMVLGQQLTNPYSIPIMTAAYNAYFFLNLSSVQTTHLYVRFTPQNEAQVALLEDSLDLDLYTHPLDHELLADGDLYIAPGKTIEDLPELYTVVTPSFVFPAGISYTVLAPIHIPEGDHGLLLEELAESMAAGATYTSLPIAPTEVLITRTDLSMSLGIEPQYLNEDAQCYITDPNGIYIGDCPDFDDNPPPPPPPPPSSCGLPVLNCINDAKPRGRIRVWDTQLQICEPVRDVKIRTKNWLKVDNTRTNDFGEFSINRKYKKRVKVNIIFRNDEVSVRPLRNNVGIRLSLLPITYTVGVYTDMCAANTTDKIFYRPENRTTREFEAWMACNAINSRKEQISFAKNPAEGLKAMDDFRLNVYLQKEGFEYYSGPQAELLMQNYVWRKRQALDYILEVGKLALYYFANDYVGLAVTLINNVLGAQKPDIMYSYNTHPDDPSLSLTNLTSNEVKQKFYDVYTQAGLLKATDNNLQWKNYFKQQTKFIDIGAGFFGASLKMIFKEYNIKLLKELPGSTSIDIASMANMAASILQQAVYSATAPDRQYFEMVRGFGNYYGHFMCDARYGSAADAIYNEKRILVFSSGGASSHRNFLEQWQPNVSYDIYRENRVGLFHDLRDAGQDVIRPEGFPALRHRLDIVGINSHKNIVHSFTGETYYLWSSPETWEHFSDIIKFQYPTQLAALNDLFVSYLIQAP